MPNARVGGRQRTCGQPQCRQQQRQRTQAVWRDRHPDYWRDRRLERQMQQAEAQGQVRIHSPPAPAPVAAIPWEQAQEAVGLKGAVFLAFLVRFSHRSALAALRGYAAGLALRAPVLAAEDGRSQAPDSAEPLPFAASRSP